MKEIKFRVWDATKGRFIIQTERILISLDGKNVYYRQPSDFSGGDITAKRNDLLEHIQTYTGLKDKNGKEIYEGDIVDCHGTKGVIFFGGGGFKIRFKKSPLNCYLGTIYDIPIIKVIGNIHENPELME